MKNKKKQKFEEMIHTIKNTVLYKTAVMYWKWFAASMVMSYILNQLIVSGNAMISGSVDNLIAGENVDFSGFIIKLLVMTVVGFIVAFLGSFSGDFFAAKVMNQFKNNAADKLVKLEYRYFDDKGAGSIINKLVSDINEANRFFSETFPQMCTSIIAVITVSVYMIIMDWKLFFVVILCYPILLYAANCVAMKLQKLAKARRDKLDERAEIAYDCIQGIIVERSYNLHDTFMAKIGSVIDEIFNNEKKRTRISSMSYVLQAIISFIPALLCYLLALYEVLHGSMSIGDLLAFVILLNRIQHPIGEIPFLFNDIMEISVSMKRLEEICTQEDEKSGSGDYSDKIVECDNIIEFEHVDFEYDEDHRIFSDLSFEIEKNKTTALVGGSGEGKTTIFKILCGFYRQQSGSYRLAGKNFNAWNIDCARKQFSLVSQNVFLLPESIKSNIAYGCADATDEQIIEACRNANIHDFIESLPDGYNTQIGERGIKLSGGERQRISIARAFLKNAPVLLLDEPTSAIDVGTERAIQEALERIGYGKTVIIIAHRLNTIKNSDNIMVFSEGKIVEQGTHDELIELDGTYAGLYGKESEHEA